MSFLFVIKFFQKINTRFMKKTNASAS